MKLRKKIGTHEEFGHDDWLGAYFDRMNFIEALRYGARAEFCGPHLSLERALALKRLGWVGEYTKEEQAAEVFDQQASEIQEQFDELDRLFANIAAALVRNLREKLARLAGAFALASAQAGLAARAVDGYTDPQALDLGLTSITLTPRLLQQRPIAARVARAR